MANKKLYVKALQMALMGYVTRVIILETGFTDKQIRRAYRELEAEGFKIDRNRTTRTTRSSATLIGNQTAKSHASLLMELYRQIGGEVIKTSICIASLERAFRMYQEIIAEMGLVDASIGRETFTISDAWSLASELRSDEAMFEECHTCCCDFFTSVHQSTGIQCPFCYEARTTVKML